MALENDGMSQIYFSGVVSCPKWNPNSFKKDHCRECGHPLPDHVPTAATEADVNNYIEYLASKNPCNEILPKSVC